MKFHSILSCRFLKSQYSSLISTTADFLVTILMTQVVGTWYLLSSGIGTVAGGYVNYSLGRNWVFQAKRRPQYSQMIRYIIVWLGSLILNMGGVLFITEIVGIHYLVSKTIIAICVGIGFNFYFQKSFVFRS